MADRAHAEELRQPQKIQAVGEPKLAAIPAGRQGASNERERPRAGHPVGPEGRKWSITIKKLANSIDLGQRLWVCPADSEVASLKSGIYAPSCVCFSPKTQL